MISKNVLSEVVKEQRDEILTKDNFVEREDIKKIKFLLSFALIISGIRRCGKSTLLKEILKKEKKFYYLNLEDNRLDGFELRDFVRVNEVFEELYGKGGVYFFDEIQNVPKWEKFVRGLVDDKKKVIVTGSNASILSRELGTLLTGRHLDFELFPFSFREFLKFRGLNPNVKSYVEYFKRGGFPEFVKSGRADILNMLLNDVVMRDIVVRFGIKNSSNVKKMAIYLISNVGKEFSYNSLKKMFEVGSAQSVIDYVSYFEDAYLIFTIPKFSYSYRKQQVNPKKVYSIDNGFSYTNSVSFSKDFGKMLENQVFLHLRRKYKEIFYFQEKGECDFVIKEKDTISEVIQVCYDLNEENQDREIKGLMEAVDFFDLKKGLILTYNQEDKFEIKDKKIIVKPVWKWLLSD